MFPFLVGLTRAIAVTHMHTSRDGDARERAIHRLDAPGVHLLGQPRDRRFVDLHHVATGRLQCAHLHVQCIGERQCQSALIAVIVIGATIDQRARARQRHLDRLRGEFAQRVVIVQRLPRLQRQRPSHARHFGLGRAAAPRALAHVFEVDVFELREKVAKVRGPPLFAIAHDVDAGLALIGEREARRIVLRFPQFIAGEPPVAADAEPLVSEPSRLGHAANDGGGNRGQV